MKPSKAPLPEMCLRILKEIDTFLAVKHYSPSIRELMLLVNLHSGSAVTHHLMTLEIAELITRVPNVSRSIVITDKGHSLLLQAHAEANPKPVPIIKRI